MRPRRPGAPRLRMARLRFRSSAAARVTAPATASSPAASANSPEVVAASDDRRALRLLPQDDRADVLHGASRGDPVRALERKVPKHAGTHPSVSPALAQAIEHQYQDHRGWSYSCTTTPSPSW